jgi:molecular chaperone DnaK (HSP70)
MGVSSQRTIAFRDSEVGDALCDLGSVFLERNLETGFEFELYSKNASSVPVRLCAHYLAKPKVITEDSLGRQVKNAAVSVPSSLGLVQRQMIEDAGKRVGMNIVRLMNEPIAAVVADYLTFKSNWHVFIFSLGA